MFRARSGGRENSARPRAGAGPLATGAEHRAREQRREEQDDRLDPERGGEAEQRACDSQPSVQGSISS